MRSVPPTPRDRTETFVQLAAVRKGLAKRGVGVFMHTVAADGGSWTMLVGHKGTKLKVHWDGVGLILTSVPDGEPVSVAVDGAEFADATLDAVLDAFGG